MARGRKIPSAQDLHAAPLFNHAPAPVDANRPAEAPPPHYHDHRARLRARFEDGGPDALADYEVLELVLFRLIPRRDVKPLAKALLARFGDLSGVLGAEPHRIAEVHGAGPSVAADLKALNALFVRASRAGAKNRDVLSSWSALIQYLKAQLQHAPREQFRVLFLDVKNQLIADELFGEGTIDQAPVYPREVVRRALEVSAASLILVHNHPSGDPKPSAADIAITREVAAAAKVLGVSVLDHVIIASQGVVSLRQLGLMSA